MRWGGGAAGAGFGGAVGVAEQGVAGGAADQGRKVARRAQTARDAAGGGVEVPQDGGM